MSYTTPPSGYAVPEPAKPARPGTVSIASLLLYLLGFIGLINVALTIYSGTLLTKDKLLSIYRDAGMDSTAADAAAGVAGVITYVTAGIGLVFAILYLVVALFVGKGQQWARITAWVLGGLGICCGLVGLAGQAASSSLSGMGGDTGVDQEKMTQALADLQPSWLAPITTVLGIISLLAAIGAVILLLLPPSHPYFRKAEPVWTPPPTFPNA